MDDDIVTAIAGLALLVVLMAATGYLAMVLADDLKNEKFN